MQPKWVGSNPDEIDVNLNRDWIETKLDAQSLTAYVKAWQAGAMSHMTLYENLQRGEIAPVDRTFEDEKDLIEEEGGDLGLDANQLLLQAAQKRLLSSLSLRKKARKNSRGLMMPWNPDNRTTNQLIIGIMSYWTDSNQLFLVKKYEVMMADNNPPVDEGFILQDMRRDLSATGGPFELM